MQTVKPKMQSKGKRATSTETWSFISPEIMSEPVKYVLSIYQLLGFIGHFLSWEKMISKPHDSSSLWNRAPLSSGCSSASPRCFLMLGLCYSTKKCTEDESKVASKFPPSGSSSRLHRQSSWPWPIPGLWCFGSDIWETLISPETSDVWGCLSWRTSCWRPSEQAEGCEVAFKLSRFQVFDSPTADCLGPDGPMRRPKETRLVTKEMQISFWDPGTRWILHLSGYPLALFCVPRLDLNEIRTY